MKRKQDDEAVITASDVAKFSVRYRPSIKSLHAPVSPPLQAHSQEVRPERDQKKNKASYQCLGGSEKATEHKSAKAIQDSAAIEAGRVKVGNHLEYWLSRLASPSRAFGPGFLPHLSVSSLRNLYDRNTNAAGRHFVIHQHDHPVSGTHYDLRLQINTTSSTSWAIMYGLPGCPNSTRLNRNATETRIHCLWNHLIETASSHTGSMIIWDTGEYEVLPYRNDDHATDDERDDSQSTTGVSRTEAEKLHEAFQIGKIRLRLHGTRLTGGYVAKLRLDNSYKEPARHAMLPEKRKRTRRARKKLETPPAPHPEIHNSGATTPEPALQSSEQLAGGSPDPEGDRATIIATNTYPGASNSIGSIHQRTWYISMDREASGFEPYRDIGRKKKWRRKCDAIGGKPLGFEPFFVRGREIERSVVTGRTGGEVLEDEGVKGYVGRKGWKAVLN